ncbi:uncharacterized protein LOC117788459 [Drosophila innubila]|uniref:uncharacterized protein LOC117788459 n=1 Tax=Drosophila innubila TaxID=198719 RepID=UPI00148CBEB5|nr:uncharacterized protein LOC117788459 [Drosophila innubila]
MPLGKNLAIGSDEARRQRAELRTSYGNKLSNKNLGRLRDRSNGASSTSTATLTTGTSSLRRIASSFAQVSDVDCGSNAALPHEDSEDDVKEEFAEVLIRSQPFTAAKAATGSGASASNYSAAYPVSALVNRTRAGVRAGAGTGTGTGVSAEVSNVPERRNRFNCSDVIQSRASERWGQIACTVSALFRVRRISHANPLSELQRLREQRDLLEAFTRPFLYEDGAHTK